MTRERAKILSRTRGYKDAGLQGTFSNDAQEFESEISNELIIPVMRYYFLKPNTVRK